MTERQREGETERDRERQRHRQTDRQTETETQTQRDRDRGTERQTDREREKDREIRNTCFGMIQGRRISSTATRDLPPSTTTSPLRLRNHLAHSLELQKHNGISRRVAATAQHSICCRGSGQTVTSHMSSSD